MSLPVWLDEVCDHIDAAVFSGDTFQDKDARDEMQRYIMRWMRELDSIQLNEIKQSEGKEDVTETMDAGLNFTPCLNIDRGGG